MDLGLAKCQRARGSLRYGNTRGVELELELILTHMTQKQLLRVGEWVRGRTLQEPRNKGPAMPLQHANRLPFRWYPRSYGYIIFHLHEFSLSCVPLTWASSLPGVEIAALLLLLSPIPARDGRFTSSPKEIKSCEEVAPRCWRAAVFCRPRCGGDVNLYREHHHPGRLESRFELGVVASTSRRSLCFPPLSVLDKDVLACRCTHTTNGITGLSFFRESEGVRNHLNRGH